VQNFKSLKKDKTDNSFFINIPVDQKLEMYFIEITCKQTSLSSVQPSLETVTKVGWQGYGLCSILLDA
jgi:hypothetical protein